MFTSADLHSIGGLDPLLNYLRNPHANIRAKAAEVVSTIVQNNPRSQQLVMEANGLEPLLHNFTSDPDVAVRTKALGAISCELLVLVGVILLLACQHMWLVESSIYLSTLNYAWTRLVFVLIFIFLHLLALIRHNKPGTAAFRLANGYSVLRDALSSESVRFQRYFFEHMLLRLHPFLVILSLIFKLV